MISSMGLPRLVSNNWATGYTLGQPNFSMWTDYVTGLTCLAILDEQGLFYHGYVAIENTHPLFACELADIPKWKVHRGVDFCKTVDVYHWIGFHCCHKLDLAPGFTRGKPTDTFRTFSYVQGECGKLALYLDQHEMNGGETQ